MPTLERIIRGAYINDRYVIDGIDYTHPELIQYILNNLGGEGTNDIIEAPTDPLTPPASGEPAVYQNTSTGVLFVWNGSQWNKVGTGSGEDDVTEGSGTPSAAPGTGEPQLYQNTDNGSLYIWNGSTWIQISGEDDITEGSGSPSGAPGAGEPVIYQDTDSGNVYTWDGSQWNLLAVVASNGLTKIADDIELGGTLEKATDVEVSSFILRMGRLVGSLLAYWRIVPATGLINLFSRDNTAGTEAGLNIQPGSAILEVDNATQVTQLALAPDSISLIANESSALQNRLQITNERIELQTERLELKTPDAAAANIGDVMTLLDPVSGQSDFRPQAGAGAQFTQTTAGMTINLEYFGSNAPVFTNPGAGIYLLTVPAGTRCSWINLKGNNSTLNGSNELLFRFANAA
ncbi:MAG: hypothetical protein AAFY48_08805, partial [Bacteroidota bacterium]